MRGPLLIPCPNTYQVLTPLMLGPLVIPCPQTQQMLTPFFNPAPLVSSHPFSSLDHTWGILWLWFCLSIPRQQQALAHFHKERPCTQFNLQKLKKQTLRQGEDSALVKALVLCHLHRANCSSSSIKSCRFEDPCRLKCVHPRTSSGFKASRDLTLPQILCCLQNLLTLTCPTLLTMSLFLGTLWFLFFFEYFTLVIFVN